MADFTSYTAKLEPFLLMSKSAKGAAAAKLVQDATAAPGLFVFAQLLELPNIKELSSNPQHAPTYSLLELFAHGTYSDYKANAASLPQLNQAQLTKLKYLSLASLASETQILPYARLLSELDMGSVRELEDLIIDAIYQDIVHGKLDQKAQQFEVEFTMGRDLREGQLQQLLVSLQAWSQRTAIILATLDKKIDTVLSEDKAAKLAQEEHEKLREQLIVELQAKSKKGRDGKDGVDDVMDVDDIGAGGMAGSVGALLGFGAKKTKPQTASGSAGGASGMFRKRNRA